MTKPQRHRVAGSAALGIAAAALLASTATPAMAAEPASLDLTAQKVSVQIATEAPAIKAPLAPRVAVAMSVSDETPEPDEVL